MRLTSAEFAALCARRNATRPEPVVIEKPVSGDALRTIAFLRLLESADLPPPISEHRFEPLRRWRFDFAWQCDHARPGVALEVQGGIWTQGRHTRGAALLAEWEKLNAAAGLGWRILFCQPDDLLKPMTIEAVRKAVLWPFSRIEKK